MGDMRPFRHVLIVGTGLIGTSLGLALRQTNVVATVSGWDRSPQHAEQAQRRRALDAVRADLDAGGADLIVLATPVAAMPELLKRVAATADPGAVITDVGSVKAPLLAQAAAIQPKRTFVGGHPMAGRAEAGPAAARADLFVGARWVLCPDPADRDSMSAATRLAALITQLGAVPMVQDAATHDRRVAAVSHLPQVASSALALAGGAALDRDREGFMLAAGGWRDTTRLAASDPEMWRDICLANKPALTAALAHYIVYLERFAAAVAAGDGEALTDLFRAAQRTAKAQQAISAQQTTTAPVPDKGEEAS